MKEQITWGDILQAVKNHADEHYNDGGWDVLRECYNDSDLTHLLEDGQGNRPTTTARAIQVAEGYVSAWAERQADAKISAF